MLCEVFKLLHCSLSMKAVPGSFCILYVCCLLLVHFMLLMKIKFGIHYSFWKRLIARLRHFLDRFLM